MGITQQLQDEIIKSGLTHYRIWKDTGIPTPTLDRFVSGERPHLQLNTVEKICDYFGLELRKKSGATTNKQSAKKTGTTKKRAKKKS